LLGSDRPHPQGGGIEDGHESGVSGIGWFPASAGVKERSQFAAVESSATGETFTAHWGEIDRSLEVFGVHKPEPPRFLQHPSEGSQVPVGSCGAVALRKVRSKGKGVLVAKTMPGKRIGPQAAVRRP
jgi:hypothetical protein